MREEDEHRNRDETSADTEQGGEDTRHDADGDQAHAAYRMDMTRRPLVTALLGCTVLFGLAGPAASGPPPLSARPLQFVVRGDPRLCPSPLCGGYWIALANHARTRCHDGLLRPRCYVASAVGEKGRPLEAGIPDGALVLAVLGSSTYGGFGQLGELSVRDMRAPFGDEPLGTFYRVSDLGIRCIRAPCFSIAAASLNRPSRVTVSDVDLGAASLGADERLRAEAALTTSGGLFAIGHVLRTSQEGRIFRASRVYLKPSQRRA